MPATSSSRSMPWTPAVGDRVLAVQEGFSAMTSVGHTESPIDAAVIGVVDQVELDVIAHLRGKLMRKGPRARVVDVNGVGYEIFVPLTTFTALPDRGSEVSIDIHTHVREDIIALYGFSTRRERTIFEKLMTISGIGPKLAVTILSGGSVEELVGAIKRERPRTPHRDSGSRKKDRGTNCPGIEETSFRTLPPELRKNRVSRPM